MFKFFNYLKKSQYIALPHNFKGSQNQLIQKKVSYKFTSNMVTSD